MLKINFKEVKSFQTDVGNLIDAMELSDIQKHTLRSRWLDQVVYMERRAHENRNAYYIFHLTAILGSLLVPALLTFGNTVPILHYMAFVISLIVAISASVEQFFDFGERWRNFRRAAETLKIEGWLYFQLSGYYYNTSYETHADAYQTFAGRVEEIIKREVAVYLSEIVGKQEKSASSSEKGNKETSGKEKII
jgi:hypothetical protein